MITATSLNLAAALLELAPVKLRSVFERVHWLVPGARIAAGLRERGLKAPLLQAESAPKIRIWWRRSCAGARACPEHSRTNRNTIGKRKLLAP